MSRRFEDVCRAFFRNKIKSGEYKDVRVGTFYFDDSENSTNGFCDVAVKKEPVRGGLYCHDVHDVEYYEEPLTEKVIRRETDDVAKIKGMNIDKAGFVSIN